MEKKLRVVFTSYVCDELITRGEEFSHIRPDLKDRNCNVFVFKNSETFDKNFDEAVKSQLRFQNRKIR